jgi:diguanylate cyclase (GGDEF)-like protein/PAS domain S-box-containing protein
VQLGQTYVLLVAALALAAITAIVFLLLRAWIRADRKRRGEEYFSLLAEAIPEIVWTAVPGGGIDYCNQRLSDLTGLTKAEILGFGWQKLLHPDDLPLALQNWEKSRRTGNSYDVEYRLRTAGGGFRWHLVRATPMRDSAGAILKWFGACADIDDQMSHQRLLEDQIKQHTDALMEANTRLQSEMRERTLAQQELNLQSERMLREMTARSNRATNLAKMAELLQSCMKLQDILSVISGMAPKIFPELRGVVLLFNSARDNLETAAVWADCNLPDSIFTPQDCWALRTGHLHIVIAGDSTAECVHVLPGKYSYFCVPLLSQGEAIGILHFQTIAAHELPDSMILMANMFAEQVGLSVANLRLREALRNQSIRDPLTGLFNRRYLEETLEREIRRAVRAEQSLGLMMLDLDHFKKFNDTYGHEAGDSVLRETASFLTKSVRAEDIVCRFGGEEFVVILPVATIKVTAARAERIRSKLRELTVLHQGRSLGMITASLGVAALPDHGTARGPLLEAVDAALYRAKREGRDRVAVAATSPASQSASETAGLAVRKS